MFLEPHEGFYNRMTQHQPKPAPQSPQLPVLPKHEGLQVRAGSNQAQRHVLRRSPLGLVWLLMASDLLCLYVGGQFSFNNLEELLEKSNVGRMNPYQSDVGSSAACVRSPCEGW